MTVTGYLESAAGFYSETKRWIEAWTGASQELLHVHAGLLIFVVASLVLRREFRSPIPLALVVAFAVLNELIDFLNGPATNRIEPYRDIANTVFWPCVLFLLARRWR
ncbi:hypothetical protein [Aurantiacibacter rhizosphaerae]|uniref:VanZ-like domain-containing protein n=1 Tax=Aurantiacibacter rhizosphaerae TaxID=2691582 RepID=A0A844X9B0_9SPHN|nr:hypothetical protein [Aurantiacibacter rhizosphaerae]MWV26991.1 hypothetical protein [Aurantiacibacter rhizosphaerae]